jgi:hypothetical protein
LRPNAHDPRFSEFFRRESHEVLGTGDLDA